MYNAVVDDSFKDEGRSMLSFSNLRKYTFVSYKKVVHEIVVIDSSEENYSSFLGFPRQESTHLIFIRQWFVRKDYSAPQIVEKEQKDENVFRPKKI